MTIPGERRAARVLLLNREQQLLLVRMQLDANTCWWILPGGGIRTGESALEAARRELLEETGIADAQFACCIWRRSVMVGYRETRFMQHEEIFLATTQKSKVAFTSLETEEARVLAELKWWNLEELEPIRPNLSPDNLAELVAELLASGPPATPLELTAAR